MNDVLPPFPGPADEAARLLPLLERVYAGQAVLSITYDGTERLYPTVHPAVRWFVQCVLTDAAGAELASLTEAQAQWASAWLAQRNQPHVEARERAALARLLAKYPPS